MVTQCMEAKVVAPIARQSRAGIKTATVPLVNGRQLYGRSSLTSCARARACVSSGIGLDRQLPKGSGVFFGPRHSKLSGTVGCRRRLRQYGDAGTRRVRTTAVFEMFTERAIKSVMLAQKEARTMKCREVGVVHLLLGLIGEDANSTIFGSGGRSLVLNFAKI